MAAPQFYTPQPKVPQRSERRFTLSEANRSLPLVSRIVRDIVNTHRRAVDLRAKLESTPAMKDAMMWQHELEASVDRLQDYVDELTAVGCELKDYESGLIDFPGRHRGHEVFLCWKLDEEKIGYWHDLQAGFAGRQPVSTLQED